VIHVCTVVCGNELAGARVLEASLRRFHPDWPMTVGLLPGLRPELRRDGEPFEVIPAAHLAGQDVEGLLSVSPAGPLAALMAPLLLAHVLGVGAPAALLLSADAEVHGPLAELEALLEDHQGLLIPRVIGRLPHDGHHPDGRDLLEAGEVDDGLVGLRAGDTSRALVEWWTERSREAAEQAAARDSPPGEVAPSRLSANPLHVARKTFDSLGWLEDPGYGVSYWNLHERPLGREGGEVTAGGRPLRLMRFAGFRADRPWWLSEHATRHAVLDDPVLSELCARRAHDLREAGWRVTLATSRDELPNGLTLDERLRRLHAQALDEGEDFGDLLSPAGADAFASWLLEPSPHGSAVGVNRYCYDVWRNRADLRQVYPNLDREHGEGFVGWLWVHGRPELTLQPPLLPPAPAWVDRHDPSTPAVLVTGYLRGNLGLGEAARGYVAALQAAEVPVATRAVPIDPPVGRLAPGARRRPEDREFEEVAFDRDREADFELVCVNPDQLPDLLEQLGDEDGEDRYRIGYWAWETELIPERWDTALALVDEVWVYSTYVAEHLGLAANVPVLRMPIPVEAPRPNATSLPVDLPPGFLFLFAFDFFSTLQRKNPVGLVEAYKTAFAPGEGPTLVLKSINADFRPQAREQLRWAIGDRQDIRLIDRTLDPSEMAALYARCDCYVSLHRAEGYGLTMAEAMALGKPVIATGYSGNVDFMSPLNSYLVDWRPTEVGPDAEHYPAEGIWAEPSLEHAASLMREVLDAPDEAARRGARAAADVEATLSPKAVGAVARARLERIAAFRERAVRPADPRPYPLSELPGRLDFALEGRGVRPGPRGLARSAMLRTIQPYTASERALDETVVASLEHLQGELSVLQAERKRDRMRLGRLERLDRERLDHLERLDREHSAGLHDAGRRLDELDARARGLLAGVRADLQPLVDGAHAIPYAAGNPFELFEHPVAGRVLGLRASGHEATSSDPVEAYAGFEAVFRGPRARVHELLSPYLELLGPHAPVLDLGCGRGELIEMLVAAGIEAQGVDTDAGMAAQARESELDVTVADAADHLREVDDASLGAITAMHVIEHLPVAELTEILWLARAKLRPGGLFVAETINPHAAHALKTFWVDPTHRHPLFPEVMLVLADEAGFGAAFIAHFRGRRDVEEDRFVEDSYALVATA